MRQVVHINVSSCAYVANRGPREVISRFPHVPMFLITCGQHVHITWTHIAHRLCLSCAKLPMSICPSCANVNVPRMCPLSAKVSLAKVSLVCKSCPCHSTFAYQVAHVCVPLVFKIYYVKGPSCGCIAHCVVPWVVITWLPRVPSFPSHGAIVCLRCPSQDAIVCLCSPCRGAILCFFCPNDY